MKTTLSAIAVAAALAAGAAQAADLPSRKAPPPVFVPPPPVLTWTGFYAGLNIGGGWQDSSSSNVANWGWNSGNGGSGGVVGGGQIGYNYQLSPLFVVGLETDFQGTSIGSGGGNGWWGGADRARINWFGTVRGRVGFNFPGYSQFLVYGTGGFAYGEVQRNSWWNQYSTVQTGWTAGGGVEWQFLPNWSAKAEYLYTDISGSNQNAFFNPGWGLNNVNNHTRFHTVRAGVNYHFNFGGAPAPVLAKY
ncbi:MULTISPECIES: outer membrane protein [Methylocystis]|uniref:Membrane protein n=1 Tax=Methylocystis iwaonis TaxID=2885079 RepID=A0ABN6VEX5_9HYPH|nr:MULTISPECIES: outer membrane beta-barrel protein [Methylocystis]MBL1255464.1 porin family protein [Methylocystis sp. Sn-Cys]MDJ0449754.1 outer membrane beta-barrel protein [Methylocystis sp. JR02]BDV32702.1 membrane protein [Methylocystis iwaonis]